jgi:hypothetical protein
MVSSIIKKMCSPVEVHQRFGRTYCFCLQDRRVSEVRNQQETAGSWFLDLPFDSKDGGSTFILNIAGDYIALHPTRFHNPSNPLPLKIRFQMVI